MHLSERPCISFAGLLFGRGTCKRRQNLLGALLRVKPRLHVFGHVHGGSGRESAWNMTRVNCAVVDGCRQLANAPTVIEIVR